MAALCLATLLMVVFNHAKAEAACPQGAKTGAAVTVCAKAAKATNASAKVSAAPVSVATAVPVAKASWMSALDPLKAGGWTLITDGPTENPSVLYASSHSVLHNGNVVIAWMRWEYSRPQAEVYPLHYLSAVTREELDCDARSYRLAAVFYYLRNNLRDKGPSFTALDDDTTWKPAIPGTEADAMLNWGCAAKGADAKPDKPGKSAADKAGAPPAAKSSASQAAAAATSAAKAPRTP